MTSPFRHNNYTVVSGLQLDIPPEIGQLNFKKVIINKNDNAEGVVEFSPDAANFIGMFGMVDSAFVC